MKVLLTGAKGQLGLSIKKIAHQYPSIIFEYTDIEELDITSPQAIEQYFKGKNFTHLINCAAYTAVDKAEEEEASAIKLNTTAVAYLADACSQFNCTFIHISTDYVFNGKNFKPYAENDAVNPSGVYSRSKAEGEIKALSKNKNSIVVRTSWLYSEFGNNFLKTIVRLASEREKLTIVSDQIGTPTYATHLAHAILEIILNPDKAKKSSIYHFSNQGVASWYDFALEIIHRLDSQCKVLPIPTEAYPLPAPRPYYSLLSKDLFTKTFNYPIPHWKEGIAECIKLI